MIQLILHLVPGDEHIFPSLCSVCWTNHAAKTPELASRPIVFSPDDKYTIAQSISQYLITIAYRAAMPMINPKIIKFEMAFTGSYEVPCDCDGKHWLGFIGTAKETKCFGNQCCKKFKLIYIQLRNIMFECRSRTSVSALNKTYLWFCYGMHGLLYPAGFY